ncbi:hypothetical protein L13192_08537 [Pyrenophora tritici-repentis]|nr:hypothetical protein L13192_08537 [Pyrenophora tritici-repentis]
MFATQAVVVDAIAHRAVPATPAHQTPKHLLPGLNPDILNIYHFFRDLSATTNVEKRKTKQVFINVKSVIGTVPESLSYIERKTSETTSLICTNPNPHLPSPTTGTNGKSTSVA